jgi:hypothetical protein
MDAKVITITLAGDGSFSLAISDNLKSRLEILGMLEAAKAPVLGSVNSQARPTNGLFVPTPGGLRL